MSDFEEVPKQVPDDASDADNPAPAETGGEAESAAIGSKNDENQSDEQGAESRNSDQESESESGPDIETKSESTGVDTTESSDEELTETESAEPVTTESEPTELEFVETESAELESDNPETSGQDSPVSVEQKSAEIEPADSNDSEVTSAERETSETKPSEPSNEESEAVVSKSTELVLVRRTSAELVVTTPSTKELVLFEPVPVGIRLLSSIGLANLVLPRFAEPESAETEPLNDAEHGSVESAKSAEEEQEPASSDTPESHAVEFDELSETQSAETEPTEPESAKPEQTLEQETESESELQPELEHESGPKPQPETMGLNLTVPELASFESPQPLIAEPNIAEPASEPTSEASETPEPHETPEEATLEIAAALSAAPQDPLLRKPRRSSVILCMVLGAVFLAAAAGVWWLAVWTSSGQVYDDLVWGTLRDGFPATLAPLVNFFTHSTYVIGAIVVVGIVAAFVVAVRRRWRLLVQIVIFALLCFLIGFTLKRVLPRPVLDPSMANPTNTSPSGHSTAAFAAAVILIIAAPMSARAIAALLAFVFATSVGLSVVVAQWHRPSDVIVAFLMVTGLALITLGFSRASGMDKAAARRSSPSVQIISTVMMVAGACGLLFAAYLFWQIQPELGSQVAWIVSAAQGAAVFSILGVAGFSLGLILALRQITASPLSAITLAPAPPAPPAPPVVVDEAESASIENIRR